MTPWGLDARFAWLQQFHGALTGRRYAD